MYSQTIKHTPLADFHRQHEAKLTEFAGWSLPISYRKAGIIAEHVQTRTACSLFDVSHMCQMRMQGQDRVTNLNHLLPLSADKLKIGRNKYTVACNPSGGILDDMIIGNDGDDFFIVCNAARTEVIQRHFQAELNGACNLEVLIDRALLAVQGPAAATAVARIFPSSAELMFMDSTWLEINGHSCRVCRSGYTGEDGFEISVPMSYADDLAQNLIAGGDCKPAGLGARDTLRIEAGLCLYGNDIDEEVTPVEANLAWALPPSARRNGLFIGHGPIQEQLDNGAPRKLVGVTITGRTPLRSNVALEVDNQQVGLVTSGTHSPTLEHPIALALLQTQHAVAGTQLLAQYRDKEIKCMVTDLPFVPHRYRTKKAVANDHRRPN